MLQDLRSSELPMIENYLDNLSSLECKSEFFFFKKDKQKK